MEIQINKLKEYCKLKHLDTEIKKDTLLLNDKTYRILSEDALIVDEDKNFTHKDESVDGFVYEFGGRWYVQSQAEQLELVELIYIGKAKQTLPTDNFLGIRSGYELMNGMGLYKNWIKKAKFLGIKALGVCEKNTLSGILSFQNECLQNEIKPIIGMTVSMSDCDVKLYVKNFQGWLNLLKFNEVINVKQQRSITQQQLISNLEGLMLVIDPKTMKFSQAKEIENFVDYYQLDTVNYLDQDVDIEYINNIEKYLNSNLNPISIVDAFYLEPEEYLTREALWIINKTFDSKTDNQYFKSKSQYAAELILMFEKENKSWISLFKEAVKNEQELVTQCNFQYDTDTRHLPKYKMTREESEAFNTNEELFISIIKKGFSDRKIKNPEKYIDRLKKEIEVLKMGDVIDYFLSLHDIVNYAKSKNMLTGIGRGSAGGSLVAYLMGIIQVDPLRFDLLFERFLNSGRMGRFEDRPLYTVIVDGESMEFQEGSLIRIQRDEKETVVFIDELKIGDKIIKY